MLPRIGLALQSTVTYSHESSAVRYSGTDTIWCVRTCGDAWGQVGVYQPEPERQGCPAGFLSAGLLTAKPGDVIFRMYDPAHQQQDLPHRAASSCATFVFACSWEDTEVRRSGRRRLQSRSLKINAAMRVGVGSDWGTTIGFLPASRREDPRAAVGHSRAASDRCCCGMTNFQQRAMLFGCIV